jgi:hypothetical protein
LNGLKVRAGHGPVVGLACFDACASARGWAWSSVGVCTGASSPAPRAATAGSSYDSNQSLRVSQRRAHPLRDQVLRGVAAGVTAFETFWCCKTV